MKRAHIIALSAAAAIALAAGTFFILTDAGSSYAAADVPANCAGLAAVPADHAPAAADNERTFDTAAAGRITENTNPGSTLICDWHGDDGTTIQLHIELWTDGDEAASDSLTEDNRSFAGKTPAEDVPDLGDQTVIAVKGTIGEGAARLGNVIVHARCIFKTGDTKTETIAVLKAALGTVAQ